MGRVPSAVVAVIVLMVFQGSAVAEDGKVPAPPEPPPAEAPPDGNPPAPPAALAPTPAPAPVAQIGGVRTLSDEDKRGFFGLGVGPSFLSVREITDGYNAQPYDVKGKVAFELQFTAWLMMRPPVNLALRFSFGGTVNDFGPNPEGKRSQLTNIALPAPQLLVAVPLRYVRPYFGVGPALGGVFLIGNMSTWKDHESAFYYGYRITAGVEVYILNALAVTIAYDLAGVTKDLKFERNGAATFVVKGAKFSGLVLGFQFATNTKRQAPKVAHVHPEAAPEEGGKK